MFRLSAKHRDESVSSSIRSCVLSGLLAFSLVATLYVSLVPFSAPSIGNNPVNGNLSDFNSACTGRRVFIYDLPPEFNVDIVTSWCSGSSSNSTWMCDYHLQNDGLGLPTRVSDAGVLDASQFPQEASRVLSSCKLLPSRSWFRTGQFSLELILHHRFRRYDCLTDSPQAADVYYLPYYVGTDIRRNLFNNHVHLRDKLVQRLIGYLEASPWWRNNPRRHVLVLGRIAWDFKRREETEGYGSSLLELPETRNMTKVLIERVPWDGSQVAVPYPTGFHPRHESEVGEWIAQVRGAERVFRVSFAGSPPRTHETDAGAVRRVLSERCEAHEECEVVRCERVDCQANPEVVNCLALRSVFCLVPPGDSLTRKGLFDSLLSGCVPVVFDRHTAGTQYLWHLPANTSEYSVYFPKAAVIDGSVDVIQELAGLSPERVSSMQTRIVEIIPRIVYADASLGGGGLGEDAFDMIVERLSQS